MSRIPDFTKVALEGVSPHAPEAAALPTGVGANGPTPADPDAWLTPEGIAVKKAYAAADTAGSTSSTAIRASRPTCAGRIRPCT